MGDIVASFKGIGQQSKYGSCYQSAVALCCKLSCIQTFFVTIDCNFARFPVLGFFQARIPEGCHAIQGGTQGLNLCIHALKQADSTTDTWNCNKACLSPVMSRRLNPWIRLTSSSWIFQARIQSISLSIRKDLGNKAYRFKKRSFSF